MVIRARFSVALALLAAGCIGSGKPGAPSTDTTPSSGECVDRDSDGFGEDCTRGADCDDHDPDVHEGCLRCATPAEGCTCAEGTAPTQCFLEPTENDDGEVMCHEGTRYCRAGKWSGCESVMTYTAPNALEGASAELIRQDAGLTRCNDCNVLCYRITDTLDPVDGGLNDTGNNVGWVNGGGLTLAPLPQDAGMVDAGGPSSEVDSDYMCTPGVGNDLDCDGIPNNLDPYPISKPFATANPSIFLQIGPGETGTGQIDLDFYLNSADVYFLVDQSGSMAEERSQLQLDLTNGDFVHDASYECADYDFNHVPNNELKNQGIIGAIKCKIRDANFGTGFFRELPFSPYGPTDQVAFGNYQDITGNVPDVLAAIGRLSTVSNVDWPEASMVSLHNVLTGSGMYFGTTRSGIPPRTDCTNQRWGYPCFRREAVPIVVMFTDAPMHNGPSANSFPYSSSNLGITAGTGDTYTALPPTNETFNGAAVLGDVTSTYKTFAGDTRLMAADLTYTQVGSSCISNSAGPDAVFRFNLTQTKTVTIETTGSQFDTVLGLFTGVPGTPSNLAASNNTNEKGTNALSLGTANMAHAKITGNTSAMAADYQWSDVGCDASSSSPDAVFKFTVNSPMQVALDTTGSSFDTVVSLHNASPALPPTYTPLAANTNDTYLTAYPAGEVYNSVKAFSGNTSTLVANYEQGQVGCGADSAGKDAFYSFTLSSPTRVRVSTEGSSFDTVLALYDDLTNPISTGSASGNDTQATSYNTGNLDGRILQINGSTAALAADYYGSQLGCNANHDAPDALFKFRLNSPRAVQIDTIGTTGWDPVVALFNSSNLDPKTYLTTTNNNDVTPQALNKVDRKDVLITGGTTASLTGDYTTPLASCSSAQTSPDAVYDFHLDNATRVQINATSSWDTVLSLQKIPAADSNVVLTSFPNDTVANAIDVGDIYGKSVSRQASIVTAHTHNYNNVGCSITSTSKDVVYSFSLSQPTEVQIDTIGTTWDTVLGLYKHTMIDVDPATPSTVAVSNNEARVASTGPTVTGPYSVGSLDNAWKRYTGNTSSMAANWTADSGCGADSNSRDAFFQFSLTAPAGGTTRNVTIDTVGSSFDTVLYLYKYNSGSSGAYTLIGCNHDNSLDEKLTGDLEAGTYFVIVRGDKANSDYGAYALNLRDNGIMSNKIACDDNGGASANSSRITASLGIGTYDVVLSGKTSTAQGAYKLRFRDKTWYDANELACTRSGTAASTTLDSPLLDPGDYRLFVTGYRSTDKGAYTLRLRDTDNPPTTPGALSCDDNGGGGANAKLVTDVLPAGDYWVALKGRSAASSGTYKLNIRDTSAAGSGFALQCDDDGGDAPQSSIERDLQAGTYQVVVKGKTLAAAGAYKLSIRDVTHLPFNMLMCSNDGGGGTTSYLEQAVTPGTYYAVVKGNAPTDKGAFALTIRDVTNRPLTSVTCNNDASSSVDTSKITTSLSAGTYYVALKGRTGTQKGPYQLSIGAGSTRSSTYSPPTWYDTLTAIQTTKTRVIPILSCHDDSDHGDRQGDCVATRVQANALADASEALGSNLQRLVFDIDSDGAGLSNAVVDAVSELAAYLEMNVTVRVIFEPDANPGFNVTVKAIDQAGDGCSGLIGITHQKCIPGAIPRFRIEIANPAAPNNVPLNPMDPNGGYNFRAELIGDGQFIVDYVPIYIIPKPAPPLPPPPPMYYPSGEYHQDVASPGCNGNQAPDWRDLDWSADVYKNTSITFNACAAQTEAGLASCMPRQIAKVTGGADCTSNAQCPIGYCNTDIGVCQITTAGSCMTSADCPSNAFCDNTSKLCTFNSQPVYIGKVLGELNFKSFMRMSIGLTGTTPYKAPPVLHRWEMTYICNQVL